MSAKFDRMYGVTTAAGRRKAPPKRGTTERTRIDRDPAAPTLGPLILIVDDSDDTRDLYAEFFSHAGMRVVFAVDGEHALLKVMTLRPDLIITDLLMPVLDGWTAIRELKAHSRMMHIPVIALTGHAAGDNLQRARDAGADAVLTKPCEPAALLDVARRLLALRS